MENHGEPSEDHGVSWSPIFSMTGPHKVNPGHVSGFFGSKWTKKLQEITGNLWVSQFHEQYNRDHRP